MFKKVKKSTLLVAVVMGLLIILSASLAHAAGPPSSSGPRIVRFEEKFGYFYGDQDRGLGILIGLDAAAVELLCTTGSNAGFDSASYMEVYMPHDPYWFMTKVRGMDHVTTLWPFTNFDCGLFTTVAPLACCTSPTSGCCCAARPTTTTRTTCCTGISSIGTASATTSSR